jgi:hypothetical protein
MNGSGDTTKDISFVSCCILFGLTATILTYDLLNV